MRTSLTKVSTVAPVRPGENAVTKMLVMTGSVVIASLVTSVVSNTIQRVLRSPVVLTKKAKTPKVRERMEKWFSLVDVLFRSVSDI